MIEYKIFIFVFGQVFWLSIDYWKSYRTEQLFDNQNLLK